MPRGRNAVTALLARHGLGFAINFLGTLLITRSVGPTAWGEYTIAYTAQVICVALLERSAVGVLVQRRIPLARRDLGTILTIEFIAGLCLGATLAGVSIASFNDGASVRLLLAATAVSIPIYSLRGIPMGLLERQLSYRRVAAVETLDSVAFNIIAVGGLAAGLGVDALAAALVVRPVPSTIASFVLAGRIPPPAFSVSAARELVAFGLPYTLSNSLGWLNSAAAPIVVGGFAGTRELGVLQLAYTLIAYPQVLNGILARVAFPMYSRLGELPGSTLVNSVASATSSTIRFVAGSMLGLGAMLPLGISWLYGAEWSSAGPIVLVLTPSFALASSYVFVVTALNAAGRARQVLFISALFTLAYWLCAIPAVILLGAIGLPLAYSVASLVLILYLPLFRSSLGALDVTKPLVAFIWWTVLYAIAAIAAESGAHGLAALVGAAILVGTFGRALLRLMRRTVELRE